MAPAPGHLLIAGRATISPAGPGVVRPGRGRDGVRAAELARAGSLASSGLVLRAPIVGRREVRAAAFAKKMGADDERVRLHAVHLPPLPPPPSPPPLPPA